MLRTGIVVICLGVLAAGILVWAVLTPPRLLLKVETEPSGAEVWINEKYIGVSPLELDLSDRVMPRPRPQDRHPFPEKQGCRLNAAWGVRPGRYWESVIDLDSYLRTTLCRLGGGKDGGVRFLVLREWECPRLRFHARHGKLDKLDFDRRPVVEEVGFRMKHIQILIHVGRDDEGLAQGLPHWMVHVPPQGKP